MFVGGFYTNFWLQWNLYYKPLNTGTCCKSAKLKIKMQEMFSFCFYVLKWFGEGLISLVLVKSFGTKKCLSLCYRPTVSIGSTTPKANHKLPAAGGAVSATKQSSNPAQTPSAPVARRSARQHPPEDKTASDKVISVNAVNAKTSASIGSVSVSSDSVKSVVAKSVTGCVASVARGKALTTSQSPAPSPTLPPIDEINTRRKTRSGAVGQC